MRPVTKWQPEVHTMPDGIVFEVKERYDTYSDAKPVLESNIGAFCSYCEDAYHQRRDLDVEHIKPKNFKRNGIKPYAHMEHEWYNYLLACSTCNGADNKDTHDVVFGECHLPHLNNTFLSLVYKAGGVVEVNPTLTGDSFSHAEKLLNLIGLNKTPATSCPGDTRCNKRKTDWVLAQRQLQKYELGKTDVENIIELVKARGGWSIWFTVFIDHRAVREALVEQFPGTSRNCFDKDYMPIPRNPGCITDPI